LAHLIAKTEAQLDAILNLESDSDLELASAGDRASSLSSSMGSDSGSDSDHDESLPVSNLYLQLLGDIYSCHYLGECGTINKTTQQLQLLLHDYKFNQPDLFRSHLHITPDHFDKLHDAICNDAIFSNNSQNPQLPVDQQLAITLFRFGHYGNAASVLKVALWAGVGYGTVEHVTKWVMVAVLRGPFRDSVCAWPDADAKKRAKEWVAEQSCPAWGDGWLMVDGTLVPLYSRPGFFGNAWFDQKSNYSMNVQVQCCVDF
jgi:hypothetical protein